MKQLRILWNVLESILVVGMIAALAGCGRNPANPDGRAPESPASLALVFTCLTNALVQDAAEPGSARAEFEKVIHSYDRIGVTNSEDAVAICNLGVACWKAGQSERALDLFKRASALARDDVRPVEFSGAVLKSLGRWDAARDAYRRALEMEPWSTRILTSLALVELGAGNPAGAVDPLRQALGLDPHYGPALYNLGVLYRDQALVGSATAGRDATAQNNSAALKAQAAEYFRRYLQSGPDARHGEVARRFLTAMRMPLPEEGVAVTREVTAAGMVASAKESVGAAQNDAALVTLQHAVKRFPRDPGPLWELAVLYDRHLAMPEKAERYYGEFIRTFSRDDRAAEAEKRLRELRAVTVVPPAPRSDPDAAMKVWAQGLDLHNRGDLAGATAAYRRALDLDPRCFNAAFNLGLVCKAQNDLPGARDAFGTALRLNPDAPKINYHLGVVYWGLKDATNAITALTRNLKSEPDYARPYYVLGLVYLDLKQTDLARANLETFLREAPRDAMAGAARAELARLPRRGRR